MLWLTAARGDLAMSSEETIAKYLEYQDTGQVEPLLALLTDDAVLVYPMRSANGKAEIEQALRSRPGMFKPDYGPVEIEGDRAKVVGKLPPGMMISAVTISFELAGNLIKRVEIAMA
jgi:ketosteroid isomerase-like protein